MTPFDPDEYLKQEAAPAPSSGGSFDPDAYLEKDTTLGNLKAQAPAANAALEHFGNAASLGYLPHIQAALEPVTSKIGDALTGGHVADELPDYVQRRDENIKRLGQEDEEHPNASLAGSIGGGIAGGVAASPLLPGGAASMAGRVLKAGATGALMGAAGNPGDTEGEMDPLQLERRGQNAALGGATGVALGSVAEGVGKLGGMVGDKLKGFAEEKAFKALGPYQRNVLQNSDDINSIGRTVLDEGVIGKVPRSYATLSERAGNAKELAGQNIENAVSELAGKEGIPSLSRKEIADSLRQRLLADESVPGVSAKNERLSALIDEFEKKGTEGVALPEARALKQGVGDQIRWDRIPGNDIPLEEQFHRGLYGELKGGEEGIAKSLAEQGQIPDGDKFLKAKEAYGNLAEAEKIADKRSDKNFANHFLGLHDVISGGAGAGVGAYLGNQMGGHEGAKLGAELGGGVGAMGSKFARTYGNQVAAKGGDALSKLISQSPALAALVQKYPGVAPALIQKSLQQNQSAPIGSQPIHPQLLQRFKDHPQLIDTLSDENLKAQVRKFIERSPSGEEVNKTKEPYIPEDEAQRRYIQGGSH